MARSAGTRLTDDWQPTEKDVLGVTLKYKVTPGQIAWMRGRFVDYFTGPDATRPVKKDWSRAFRNWCDTDAPKAKRAVRQEQEIGAARGPTNWRWVCGTFKKTGKWYSSTPEPGYGGCECPLEILREFGLLQKKEGRPQVAARPSVIDPKSPITLSD